MTPERKSELRVFCHSTICGVTSIQRGLKECLDENNYLEAELAAVKKVIAGANNSLFGSDGFFLSLNEGPPNEHHLAKPIEKLKAELFTKTLECERLSLALHHCLAGAL